MNQIKAVRGVDRVVGEFLTMVPDVDEFLGDLEEYERRITADLELVIAARRQLKLAELSLESHVRLLGARLTRGRDDWSGRRHEIEAGASDVGVALPALGFRVVKEFPEVGA